MSTSPRSLLLAALLSPLVSPLAAAGAAQAGPCPGDDGGCPGGPAAAQLLAWQDWNSGRPLPDDRGRGDYRYDARGGYDDDYRYGPRGGYDDGYGYGRRGGYDQGYRYREPDRWSQPEPPRRGPLPPQAYPGGVRPNCAPGTHLEGWDCVRNPSGPAIIDQPRQGCPRDYHTNRKGTKCIRDGYTE